MNEPTTVLPTQTETAPAAASVPPPPPAVTPLPKPNRNKFLVIAVILAVSLLLGLVWYFSQPFLPEETPLPLPTPTSVEIATPTPLRPVSRLATTSAYLTFGQSVASLSAYLDTFPVSDAALTPPAFELDLGLTE